MPNNDWFKATDDKNAWLNIQQINKSIHTDPTTLHTKNYVLLFAITHKSAAAEQHSGTKSFVIFPPNIQIKV